MFTIPRGCAEVITEPCLMKVKITNAQNQVSRLKVSRGNRPNLNSQGNYSRQRPLWSLLLYPGIQSMPKGYIVFISSVNPFVCLSVRPSVRPGVIPSVNPFYNQILLLSFLITCNSAATDQKLFIFGMGVPGRVLFHFTSVDL